MVFVIKRGREEIILTKEQIIEATNKVKQKTNGKIIQKYIAEELGVSYPIFLREKQRLDLDPKSIELTEKQLHLEKIDYDEESFENHMMELDERAKPISYEEYEYEFDESIILAFLGDSHIGSPTTRYMEFWNFVKDIKRTANTKVILLADLIDNFSKYGPGSGIYDQLELPPEQKIDAEFIIKYLGKEKILGIIQGSHEEFSYNADSFDFAKYLANKIGIPYLGFGALITFHIGENIYRVYVSHEDRYYSKANLCHGLKRICREEVDFDLGVSAHNHVGDMEYFENQGEPKRAIKISGYKDPDRFLQKNKFFIKPVLNVCAVLLAEPQKYKNWGIVLFEDFDHAVRFL